MSTEIKRIPRGDLSEISINNFWGGMIKGRSVQIAVGCDYIQIRHVDIWPIVGGLIKSWWYRTIKRSD
jgi:hypothetical protein